MESTKNIKLKNDLASELKKEYLNNLKDPTFAALVKKLHIKEEVGCLNNSLLLDSVNELKNCQDCKGCAFCQNKVVGHYLYPTITNNIIELSYVPCAYFKEEMKLKSERATASNELATSRFKDIDVTDKNRVDLIKWLREFYDNYDGIKESKGLYLHGTFGSGKTYLIYALLNELKINKKVNYAALYYPEALRNLKDDWDSYNDKINYYSNVDILLLDDIGSETLSEWSRDEVLGTILQTRMNNHLTTFFTSNLTLEELESHLASTKNNVDKVKARRIIERIKQLTIDKELISNNKRK